MKHFYLISVITTVVITVAFFAGWHAKQLDYDTLQHKYTQLDSTLSKKLEESERQRVYLTDSVASLNFQRQILFDSLNNIKPIIIFREKLKTLTDSELEALMLSEYKKHQ